MKIAFASLTVAASLFASVAFAAAPADAPAGSTGICKDGSYSSAAARKGACRGHQGIKEWYAADVAVAAPAAASAAMTPPAARTAAPATKTAMADKAAAPGGGPGQVWVNTRTKVYHCSTDKAYGKTKEGAYMTEAAAKAAGDHASHGKACAA